MSKKRGESTIQKKEDKKALDLASEVHESVPLPKPPVKQKRKIKPKWIIVFLIIVGIIAGGWYFLYGRGPQVEYDTVAVERGTIERTVEVTGEVKPSGRFQLSFEQGGVIKDVFVAVGDEIEEGDLLAELNDKDLQFAMRQAEANLASAQAKLDQSIAGETNQAIRIAEAAVVQAEANLKKAETDYTNIQKTTEDEVKSTEVALKTAENSYFIQKSKQEQAVEDAYQDLRLSAIASIGTLQTALTDGDRIIGVDDKVTNSLYAYLLGAWGSGSVDTAKSSYSVAKNAKNIAETSAKALTPSSSNEAIETAADLVQDALLKTQLFLSDVKDVLAGTISGTALSSTTLEAMKTEIDADFSSVSTQLTTVTGYLQGASTALLTKEETLQTKSDAVDTARLNVEIAKTNADTKVQSAKIAIDVAEAALSSAEATLDLKKSGPRDVDLDPLRAAVDDAEVRLEQAQKNMEKIRIFSPVKGTVAEILPEVGEIVTANQDIIRILGNHAIDIEVLIPEADIALVQADQRATITLDAYGDDIEFDGEVISEEPDQTIIQDAVYYKARVTMNDITLEDFKPGMTANVIIHAQEARDTLIIPSRAIRTDADTGERLIRILRPDGTVVDSAITIGLRGDEGKTSVLSGVEEGDQVVIAERTK